MENKLSRLTKILYGAGDTGFSLTGSIAAAYLAIFLIDVVGLSPSMAAAAIFVGRTWDYVNDPFIGHISDRTRSRWGRRRPFLLFGPLPFALAFSLLWWRPPIESQLGLAVYYALAYVVFDAAATFVYMPYFALTPELTQDYDERTSLTSYRMFFSILGSLIAFTVPLMMVGGFSPDHASRVWVMGLTFGVVSALPLLLAFFGTSEREVYQAQERPSLVGSLKAAFSNRPFVFGVVIYLLTWMAVNILEANLLFFIKYQVKREGQSDLIMATIFVTAIIALPVWVWASRRWNKRLAYAVGIAFWAVVQMVLITLTAATPFSWLLVLCVLAGIGVAAAHVLPWSILPDAVEWGEMQTGQRNEGMFYSLITLTQKIASSIAIPLTLVLLEATGYVANAADQPASALTGIRVLIGPLPAALLCLGILFALFYPLTRESHAEIVEKLEERRASPGSVASE